MLIPITPSDWRKVLPAPSTPPKRRGLYFPTIQLRIGRIVRPREPFLIGEVSFEAFPVDHSLLAPAYRVKALDG
jgi:hypothetical protein